MIPWGEPIDCLGERIDLGVEPHEGTAELQRTPQMRRDCFQRLNLAAAERSPIIAALQANEREVAVARGKIPAQAFLQPDLAKEFLKEDATAQKLGVEHHVGRTGAAGTQRGESGPGRILRHPFVVVGALNLGAAEYAHRGENVGLRHHRVEREQASRRGVKPLRQHVERALQGAILDDAVVELS
jgi:hypothetical protein